MKKQDFDSYFYKNHLNDEALALFTDALLLGKEENLPAAIRNHVEDCLKCKKEIMALYEIMKKDGVNQNTEVHPYLNNHIVNEKKSIKLYNIFKIAAVLLLLIGLSSLIYYVFMGRKNSNMPNNTIAHHSDSINKLKNDNISINQTGKETDSSNSTLIASNNELALNMQESPLFENLIASHYRSNDIEISFPPLNHSFNSGQAIIFKINGDVSEPIVLIIYNNKEKKIIEKDNISTKNLLVHNKLSTGLYYWKVLKEDNLVQVGKFFVK